MIEEGVAKRSLLKSVAKGPATVQKAEPRQDSEDEDGSDLSEDDDSDEDHSDVFDNSDSSLDSKDWTDDEPHEDASPDYGQDTDEYDTDDDNVRRNTYNYTKEEMEILTREGVNPWDAPACEVCASCDLAGIYGITIAIESVARVDSRLRVLLLATYFIHLILRCSVPKDASLIYI